MKELEKKAKEEKLAKAKAEQVSYDRYDISLHPGLYAKALLVQH